MRHLIHRPHYCCHQSTHTNSSRLNPRPFSKPRQPAPSSVSFFMPLPVSDLSPVSLPAHLSVNRNLKSPPPSTLVRTGVACLSTPLLDAHNLHALDLLLLSSPCSSHYAIVTLWPLAALHATYIALDDISMAALCVDPFPPPPSLQNRASPLHTPGKRKTKSNRRRSASKHPSPPAVTAISPIRASDSLDLPSPRSTLRSNHTRAGAKSRVMDGVQSPTGNVCGDGDGGGNGGSSVKIERVLLAEEQCVAQRIVLRLVNQKVALESVQSEEYRNMLQVEMRGRLVVEGMRVLSSFLGMDVVFEVQHVMVEDGGEEGVVIGRCYEATAVRFLGEEEGDHDWRLVWESIGGLKREMHEFESHARAALGEVRDGRWSATYRPRGALLHGPPGTGKTMMACAVGGKLGVAVEVLSGPQVLSDYVGEAVRNLDKMFARAKRRRPCVVVLDEVDAIAPKRDAAETDNVQRKLTAALLTMLDGGMGMEGVFVVGTTNTLEAVDGAMRRAGRFDVEIEIGVPDGRGRGEILEGLVEKARKEGRVKVSPDEVLEVGRVAYGFVGADLCALWREAVSGALGRGGKECVVGVEDLRRALQRVQPSALREVSVEIPKTRWDDIGGKVEAKRRLKEAVEWPLSERGRKLFEQLGVLPPAGVLLFGPPGCSKTLLARAVATESGANFISVKGGELLSKWVGESEKAVRAIFKRARLAAPCVIFFDEVDSLAGKRSGMSGASAQSRVVAQLLAEMDGIERDDFGGKERVVVIAATNRPDCLDEAFLRPGRIDTQIYIGLPDKKERLAILEVHTRGMPLLDDVELDWIAGDEITGGFSGAEIGGLVREAGMAAMERDIEGVERVEKKDFQRALERVSARTPQSVMKFFDEYVNRVGRQGCGLIRIS